MFGMKVKQLRKDNDMTQSDLANILKCSLSKVAMWETEKRDPTKDDLILLSNVFNVSIDYLLGRTNERNDDTKSNKIDINKNEKDVEELLEETMSQILGQDGLMLNGEIVDDNDLMLLRNALKNGIEYVKSMKSKK